MIIEYGYTFGAIFLSIVWLSIFLKRPDLRRQMLFVGFLITPVVIVAFFLKPFVSGYWHPTVLFHLNAILGFSIEDIFFVFTLSGITSVLYEVFTKKSERLIEQLSAGQIIMRTFGVFIFLFLTFAFLSSVGLWKHLYSSLIPNIILITYIWIRRKDLMKIMAISGLLGGLMYFVFFAFFLLIFPSYIKVVYNLTNLWGVYILRVPLEEIIWGFHFSALMGGIYEYIFRIKLEKIS